MDAGWACFMDKLKYKCEWFGKTLLQLGQFEPSTKICSNCGHHNPDLKLHQRNWSCPLCGVKHDRDINAAINIRDFALNKQNPISTVGTTEIKASPRKPQIVDSMKEEPPSERKG